MRMVSAKGNLSCAAACGLTVSWSDHGRNGLGSVAHCKWRFSCFQQISVILWMVTFRGRRSIWWCWRMASVAPCVVNEVSYEPCFFLLHGAYTLAWRLRRRLRRATMCGNVGYARLRGIHLPTRNASARNRGRTFFIYLRSSCSWRRRTWRTGAWRRGLGSKALCLAYKQNRELLNLDYGPADGQGPVGWLCWLRECLRGGYAEATLGRELESEIRKGQ